METEPEPQTDPDEYIVELIYRDRIQTYDDVVDVSMPMNGEGFFRLAGPSGMVFVMQSDDLLRIEVTPR